MQARFRLSYQWSFCESILAIYGAQCAPYDLICQSRLTENNGNYN